MGGVLLIRADAGPQLGIGHVMRCMALAKGWQAMGGSVLFAMAACVPSIESRLHSEGARVTHLDITPGSVADSLRTAALARCEGAEWVVVDGYHFDAAYQRAVAQGGRRLLLLDDYGHAEHYYAELVLNQNLSAREALYARREPHTRLLLGTDYVLLRPEFWTWRRWKRNIPETARKVLVTLGGSDPDNATLKVIRAVQQVESTDLEAAVAIGGSNPHYEQLRSALRGWPGMCSQRDATDMAELMAWADMAISAGGSTCWELAFMGLPTVVLTLAENQRPIAEGLAQAGVAVNMGSHQKLYAAEIAAQIQALSRQQRDRRDMSERGRRLVDGQGVHRVLARLAGVHLRPVGDAEARLLWEWVNDPDVRRASFSMESISWEQHLRWFESKMTDPDCVAYIAEHGDSAIPIGQVRYEVAGHEAVVSISVDRRYRRQGYGARIIWLSSQQLLGTSSVDVIHAYIKLDNQASLRAFLRAGYQKRGTTVVRGSEAVHLVLRGSQ